jgi:hypothetical protein
MIKTPQTNFINFSLSINPQIRAILTKVTD